MENNSENEETKRAGATSSGKQTDSSNSFPIFKAPLPVNLKERQQKQEQQQQKDFQPPPVPYEKPEWSDLPKDDWSFEVIKSGMSLEIIKVPTKEFLVLGRLPICDIAMEHPSISRYHAIIQFNNKGEIFLYDLDSAHGTIVNKQRISPQHFTKLRTGDQLKFGESTRAYVLLGPEEPQPKFSESKRIPKLVSKPAEKITGVTWGFAEDAEDEGEMNVAAVKESWKRDENSYYYKDPKKALRTWLENRGYDMEFENEQEGPGHSRTFTARIRLPDVEDAYGPVYGLGTGSKRKDAERQAAIDACEKLDMLGLLRASRNEASVRKKRMRELLGDDDDDDDNDSFYDRTGQAERAKLRKILPPQKVETYESLTKQREELTTKIEETRSRISNAREFEKSSHVVMAEDDLDSYMSAINKDLNGESVTNLEVTLQDLLKQDQKLIKLIEIARPLDIMQSNSVSKSEVTNSNATMINKELNINVNSEKSQSPSSNDALKIPTPIDFEHHDNNDDMDDVSLVLRPPKKSNDKISQKKRVSLGKEEINDGKEKNIKTLIPMTPQEYEKKRKMAEELNELEVEDGAIAWDPPKGQTGDGRTALNDKYGY